MRKALIAFAVLAIAFLVIDSVWLGIIAVDYGMARPSENIEYDVSLLKGKEPSHADFHIGCRHWEEQLQCCWC